MTYNYYSQQVFWLPHSEYEGSSLHQFSILSPFQLTKLNVTIYSGTWTLGSGQPRVERTKRVPPTDRSMHSVHFYL